MRDMPVPDPISVRGLTYRTGGSTLVADVSLDFTRGHVTAIMGPNGAGKSVLLRLIAGLISLDSGSSVSEEQIALVFQRPVLLRRSVSANLDHALRTHGISRKDRSARLSELMKICDLEQLAKHPARRLSGGEQQRVAMARAFAAMPTLLLLDEPTASLDPSSTARIEALISQAAADGIAVALVTHDAGQARRIADTVAFLHKGRLTEHTSVSQFFPQPASAEARAYLAGDLLT